MHRLEATDTLKEEGCSGLICSKTENLYLLNTLKREKCVVMAVRGQKGKVWTSWTRPERGKRVELVGERSKCGKCVFVGHAQKREGKSVRGQKRKVWASWTRPERG